MVVCDCAGLVVGNCVGVAGVEIDGPAWYDVLQLARTRIRQRGIIKPNILFMVM